MKDNLAIRLAALLVAACCLSGCLAGKYMVKYALIPDEHGNDLVGDRAKWEQRIPGIMDWYDSLHVAGVFRDTVITGEGGCRLHAVYAPAAPAKCSGNCRSCALSEPHGTAVLVHGYTDNHLCMMHLARMYRDSLGFNVLVLDHHFHGMSEGRAIQMGWLDRLDVERWIEVAHNIFQDDLMLVHGVSMGGACTMMVSGDDLPEYVRGFIDDCGYSSVWNQFAKELKEGFHLPPFPVLTSANIVCRHRYGWDFKEASSLDQLAKCTRPMLFIHGDSDDFVPTADVYLNYEAKTRGYKDIWVVPDTDHANSYENHPAEYTEKVRAFIRVCAGQAEKNMLIDFNSIEEKAFPAFKGGEKELYAKMFFDGQNRVMQARLLPGASIGMHTHDTSSEIMFFTEGCGSVIFDGEKIAVKAGDVHYCPKGHTHTLINDSDAELKFSAVVPQQ